MNSIGDELGSDHRRLDGLFERLRAITRAHDPVARTLLVEFASGLSRHMAWEEEQLFPSLLRLSGDRRRHVASLEADHALIRDHLSAGRDLLDAGRYAEALDELDSLRVRLIGHNDDEEFGAYRDADRYMTPHERERLLAAFLQPGGTGLRI